MIEIAEKTIKSALSGNHKSFQTIYEYYSPYIWKVIYRTVNGDPDTAAEVLQQTFIRVFKSGKQFKFNSHFSTWLYRIAYNTALTVKMREQVSAGRTEPLTETAGSNSQNAEHAQREVESIMASLCAEDRFLLTGNAITGLSYEELSEITGKSAAALRIQIFRIKEAIRKKKGWHS